MKYQDTPEDARQYNQAKDPQARTGECVNCGVRISMTGDNCIPLAVYLCPGCRDQRKRTKSWTVVVSDLQVH